jgi:hypothetical protein
MMMRRATARSIISTQHTAILPTPLRLRRLIPLLIAYKKKNRRKRTHLPGAPCAAPVLQEYLWSKRKNLASSEDTLTSYKICALGRYYAASCGNRLPVILGQRIGPIFKGQEFSQTLDP